MIEKRKEEQEKELQEAEQREAILKQQAAREAELQEEKRREEERLRREKVRARGRMGASMLVPVALRAGATCMLSAVCCVWQRCVLFFACP